MSLHPNDDLDRIIDETLASMVEGEPRRVSAATVRQEAGRRPGFALPVWLAAAAVLILGIVFASRPRVAVQETPRSVARVLPSPSPAPHLAASSEPGKPAGPSPAHANSRIAMATTTEPVYAGLPRLTIPSIDRPEPLATARLAGNDPIQLQSIDITPLSIATLSNENNQE